MARVLLVFLLFVTHSVLAKTVNESGLWLSYNKQEVLSEIGRFHFETQLRHNLSHGKMGQTLVRFGYLHKLDKHKVGFLFAYVDSDSFKEYRPTLQHQISVNNFILLRSRVEYRNIEDNDQDSWRYRLLTRLKNFELADRTHLVIWNEAFLNLSREDYTGNRTFERNRLFFGPGHKLKNVTIEWGYLNQYIPRTKSDTIEHLLVSYFYF